MDRWGPMPGYAHCALRGNGYHDALGGRGARALRFDSTLRRRAGDAAPAPNSRYQRDRELGDVTVRNFVGGRLNIKHHSDDDLHGVINAGIADKVKK